MLGFMVSIYEVGPLEENVSFRRLTLAAVPTDGGTTGEGTLCLIC